MSAGTAGYSGTPLVVQLLLRAARCIGEPPGLLDVGADGGEQRPEAPDRLVVLYDGGAGRRDLGSLRPQPLPLPRRGVGLLRQRRPEPHVLGRRQLAGEVVGLDPASLDADVQLVALGPPDQPVKLGQAAVDALGEQAPGALDVQGPAGEQRQPGAVDEHARQDGHLAAPGASQPLPRLAHVRVAAVGGRPGQHRPAAAPAPEHPLHEQVALRHSARAPGRVLRRALGDRLGRQPAVLGDDRPVAAGRSHSPPWKNAPSTARPVKTRLTTVGLHAERFRVENDSFLLDAGSPTGTVTADYQYVYDKAGNITSRTDLSGAAADGRPVSATDCGG
jgi:YD repeat-containing protein